MKLFSYIFPQTVARFSTPYNREIRINEEKGKYKLLVNGSSQSGEYVKKLWQHAFVAFGIIPSPDIRSILVLGVAGGTVIHLARALFPQALIEGVDIDPKMLDIGRQYFGLNKIEGLMLTASDAFAFLSRAADQKKHWDLILVDVHVGPNVPPFIGEPDFLQLLKKSTSAKGMVIINYLREREYKKLSDLLFEKLNKIFQTVTETQIYFNRFFCCK